MGAVSKVTPLSRRRADNSDTRTLGELGRNIDELRDDVDAMQGSVEKLNGRFTLFFGLGIGAMAASGVISDQAAALLKTIVGGF